MYMYKYISYIIYFYIQNNNITYICNNDYPTLHNIRARRGYLIPHNNRY